MAEMERIWVGIILGFGLLAFVYLAWQRRGESFRLHNFFLGGGSVGPELTEHNSIGLTFAWMGGTWFFTLVAYQNGPWVMLLQLPWCFSIVVLALLFRRIRKVIGFNTIHGFLRDAYSPRTQVIAAIATTIGYLINMGFEIVWSSLMLAHCIGSPSMALELAVVLGTVCSVYCMIGGYIANATTDKPQNILGVISLAVLVIFVAFHLPVPSTLFAGAIVFVVGAIVYSGFACVVPRLSERRSERVQSSVAFVFALTAICVCLFLMWGGGENREAAVHTAGRANLVNTLLPLPLLIGLLSFQLIFNAIDMANWQQVAANTKIPESTIPAVQWSIVRSALYLLWFPALGGTLLGCALRFAEAPSENETVFAVAFAHVAPDLHAWFRGILLGVVTLGLVSTTLSTADSYLMSAAQTLASDVLFRGEYRNVIEKPDETCEREFVLKCRRLLVPVGWLAIGLAYTLWRLYPQGPLDFQSLMYAWALTLSAPVLIALCLPGHAIQRARHAFYGIATALAIASGMFSFAVLGLPDESPLRTWLINLLPIIAIATPFLFMLAPRRTASV